MAEGPIPAELVDRYLAALGVSRRPPSRAALGELVAAHLTRVPFENVSKLLAHRLHGTAGLPPLERFLAGIERHRLGGTCYANNCHLWSLLLALGYQARLYGADMSAPDVHAAIAVRLDGREWLVDGGFGSPFLAPLPLDGAEDHQVPYGHESYRLRPRDARGRSALEVLRRGQWQPGYLLKPEPRTPAHFAGAMADSFRPGAYFLTRLRLYRFAPGSALALRNLWLIEATPERAAARRLGSRAELPAVVEERFGIPAGLVAEALEGLGELEDSPD